MCNVNKQTNFMCTKQIFVYTQAQKTYGHNILNEDSNLYTYSLNTFHTAHTTIC